MDTQMTIALLAAAVALTGTFVSWRLGLLSYKEAQEAGRRAEKSSADLEKLKADLEKEVAEDTARRDYEYEARKKIHSQLGPLFFQLAELSDAATHEIAKLCDRKHWARLTIPAQRREELERHGFIGSTTYDSTMASYALLAPVASHRLIQRQLTSLDLFVDQGVLVKWILLRSLYESFSRDDDLADAVPALDYDPRVTGWRSLRKIDPQKYWWQGVTRGRLDGAVTLITRDLLDSPQILTFGEFERLTQIAAEGGPDEKPLGAFSNALYDFTPTSRPVFWRLLAVQAVLHRAICYVDAGSRYTGALADLDELLKFDSSLRTQFELGPDAESVDQVESVVERYMTQFVRPLLVAAMGRSTSSGDRLVEP